MQSGKHSYVSYLLRLWLEAGAVPGETSWRASLQHIESGQRIGFTSLHELFDYLASTLPLEEVREVGGKPTY